MKTDKTHRNHPHLSLTRTAVALSFAAVALLTAPSLQLLLLFPSAFGIDNNNNKNNNNIPTTAVSLTDSNNGSSATSAAANTTTTTTTATAAAATPNSTLIDFASNIEQIRGHLDQAVVNKESGNDTLTVAHSLHPIEEVYSSIEGLLARQNSTLNQTLSLALQELSSGAANSTASQFKNQTSAVDMLLNDAVRAIMIIIPSQELGNTAFNASVVARLLSIAGHEYQEAVANGIIREVVEYQDAQAFIHRAQTISDATFGSVINQTMANEIEQVNEYFGILNNTVINKGDPAEVETTINGTVHELEEITGMPASELLGQKVAGGGVLQQDDPVAIIDNVKSMLNQLLSAYQSQNYEEAESIAIEAYLENYEFVEAPIAQHDQQLMEETEVMLREELRQLINDRVPVEQLQEHIASINANLDRAVSLLEQ
jgi:uncharacterized protein (DUF697 family)